MESVDNHNAREKQSMNSPIEIVITDLDGTLLNSCKEISKVNLKALVRLGEKGITRVIATGRSLYSFNKLTQHALPIDFLIFSNGAGIYDIHSQSLLRSYCFDPDDIEYISYYLQRKKVDFMIHQKVPENHRFIYYRGKDNGPDFNRRITLYADYCREWRAHERVPAESSQIIAVLPDDIDMFHKLAKGLDQYHITRTTSPLDGKSIWMEIYPHGVSKGLSSDWLCNHLRLNINHTLSIGNDFNDISLLDFSCHRYIVANAPKELHTRYSVTRPNDEDGFFHALQKHFLVD